MYDESDKNNVVVLLVYIPTWNNYSIRLSVPYHYTSFTTSRQSRFLILLTSDK